jgi:thiamine biosynthesis protein ThiS
MRASGECQSGCPYPADFVAAGAMSTSEREIEITVNGDVRRASEGRTVQELLEDLGIPSVRVAVELNRNILKREDWSSTRLHGGEQLEIVHFVGGG